MHSPLLETYGAIREIKNIVLVCGRCRHPRNIDCPLPYYGPDHLGLWYNATMAQCYIVPQSEVIRAIMLHCTTIRGDHGHTPRLPAHQTALAAPRASEMKYIVLVRGMTSMLWQLMLQSL